MTQSSEPARKELGEGVGVLDIFFSSSSSSSVQSLLLVPTVGFSRRTEKGKETKTKKKLGLN
jgi:hypothetical protein